MDWNEVPEAIKGSAFKHMETMVGQGEISIEPHSVGPSSKMEGYTEYVFIVRHDGKEEELHVAIRNESATV